MDEALRIFGGFSSCTHRSFVYGQTGQCLSFHVGVKSSVIEMACVRRQICRHSEDSRPISIGYLQKSSESSYLRDLHVSRTLSNRFISRLILQRSLVFGNQWDLLSTDPINLEVVQLRHREKKGYWLCF